MRKTRLGRNLRKIFYLMFLYLTMMPQFQNKRQILFFLGFIFVILCARLRCPLNQAARGSVGSAWRDGTPAHGQ
jgi:hypothetical protein